MKLLTFAHRGEAQAFLSTLNFKAVDFFFDGLLRSEDAFLLITGEGVQSASEKTICTLSRFADEIDEVVNIGVAGSLNDKIKKYDLIWVRTAYAHHAEKLEFKSFSSSHYEKSSHDCMTAFTRVLDENEKKKLALFADLVDRELWAVASAAHLFKKPFRALKIISDEMRAPEADICKFVKEEASLYSQKLLEEFSQKKAPTSSDIKHENDFIKDHDFYFTVSQERKLLSTLEGLRLKETSQDALYKDPYILSLKEDELIPKERTRLLLVYLTEKLNPISKKIREQIDEKLAPLKEARIHATYDNDFEEDWLNLSVRIQSSRDLERAKNALKIFSYEDFKKVLDGQFDV